jgi:hypothetical protein
MLGLRQFITLLGGAAKLAIVVREAYACASPIGLPWALVTERRLRSRLCG